jgi:hypothetical protein
VPSRSHIRIGAFCGAAAPAPIAALPRQLLRGAAPRAAKKKAAHRFLLLCLLIFYLWKANKTRILLACFLGFAKRIKLM